MKYSSSSSTGRVRSAWCHRPILLKGTIAITLAIVIISTIQLGLVQEKQEPSSPVSGSVPSSVRPSSVSVVTVRRGLSKTQPTITADTTRNKASTSLTHSRKSHAIHQSQSQQLQQHHQRLHLQHSRALPLLRNESPSQAISDHDIISLTTQECNLPELASIGSIQCRMITEKLDARKMTPSRHRFKIEVREHANHEGGVVTVVHENCVESMRKMSLEQLYPTIPQLSHLFAERFGPDMLELRIIGAEYQVKVLEPLLHDDNLRFLEDQRWIPFSCTYQTSFSVAISGLYDIYLHLIHTDFDAIRSHPSSLGSPSLDGELLHLPFKFLHSTPIEVLAAELRFLKERHESSVSFAREAIRDVVAMPEPDDSDEEVLATTAGRAAHARLLARRQRAQATKPIEAFKECVRTFLAGDVPFWQPETGKWLRIDTEVSKVFEDVEPSESAIALPNPSNKQSMSTIRPLAARSQYRYFPFLQWSSYREVYPPSESESIDWLMAEEMKRSTQPNYRIQPHAFQVKNQGEVRSELSQALRFARNHLNLTIDDFALDFLQVERYGSTMLKDVQTCLQSHSILFVGDDTIRFTFEQIVRIFGSLPSYRLPVTPPHKSTTANESTMVCVDTNNGSTRMCFIYVDSLTSLLHGKIVDESDSSALPQSFFDLLGGLDSPPRFSHTFLGYGHQAASRGALFESYASEMYTFALAFSSHFERAIARPGVSKADRIARRVGLTAADEFPHDGVISDDIQGLRIHRHITFISALSHPRLRHHQTTSIQPAPAPTSASMDRRTTYSLALYNELSRIIWREHNVTTLDAPFQSSYDWIDQLDSSSAIDDASTLSYSPSVLLPIVNEMTIHLKKIFRCRSTKINTNNRRLPPIEDQPNEDFGNGFNQSANI